MSILFVFGDENKPIFERVLNDHSHSKSKKKKHKKGICPIFWNKRKGNQTKKAVVKMITSLVCEMSYFASGNLPSDSKKKATKQTNEK